MNNFPQKIINLDCRLIFIASGLDFGGAEKILFDLAKTMSRKKIILISLTDIGFYGQKLNNMGYEIYALGMKKNIFAMLKIIKLIFLIQKFKPKIVHTWLYHANLIGGICAKILRVKNIFWSIHHDYEQSSLLMFLEMKMLILLSYLIPQKIIFCSLNSKINHVNAGYKKCSSILINNGISTDFFKPNNDFKKEVKSQLNINDTSLILGNISRYHPIKDHDNLLKALSLLKSSDVIFKCILIGDGLSLDNLELVQKIKKYNLKKEIILYGMSREVNKLINVIDINILSSIKEAFPMVLLETMASGIPSVSTNVGDAEYIIGNSGWIVDNSDPKALFKILKDICRKSSLIREKGLLARIRVKEKFTLNTMIQNYSQLYK